MGGKIRFHMVKGYIPREDTKGGRGQMKLIREVKLEKGYHSSDLKTVAIVDSKSKEVIADGVDVEYAELIIRAVNEYREDTEGGT